MVFYQTHHLTKQDIKKRLNSRKAIVLANVEQQAIKDDKRQRGVTTSDNFLLRFAYKIINNLQVVVDNVHLR